ncbi:hypothetical protein MTAT_26340 [Moorella thermoacetica]|uniref:Uncharacterized protein n=1 Tax=Neomoorella thermoacetica TaxID=1525 RepID=A0AAC9HG03_NEOTH|nr:hypothetical protein [Moorella thermoacetica]AOQ23063.1 hypothetical protein Maut_00600 [Moorella thermoacetica]TYL08970.1 hypothetical protein MTAT_26340 [Moorella thermoacetica]
MFDVIVYEQVAGLRSGGPEGHDYSELAEFQLAAKREKRPIKEVRIGTLVALDYTTSNASWLKGWPVAVCVEQDGQLKKFVTGGQYFTSEEVEDYLDKVIKIAL